LPMAETTAYRKAAPRAIWTAGSKAAATAERWAAKWAAMRAEKRAS